MPCHGVKIRGQHIIFQKSERGYVGGRVVRGERKRGYLSYFEWKDFRCVKKKKNGV